MSTVIDYSVYSKLMEKTFVIKASNISFLNGMIRFELNGVAKHWFPIENTTVKRLTP